MKRRLISLLLSFSLAFVISACGKDTSASVDSSESANSTEETANGTEGVADASSSSSESSEGDSTSTSNAEQTFVYNTEDQLPARLPDAEGAPGEEDTPENNPALFADYSPLQEIIDAQFFDCKIQIGDTIYSPTMLVQDVVDAAANSALELTPQDYNPDKLMTGGAFQEIPFYSGNTEVMTAFAFNPIDNGPTLSLSQCAIYFIYPSTTDEIKNITYVCGGIGTNENSLIHTYQDLMNYILDNKIPRTEEQGSNDTIVISIAKYVVGIDCNTYSEFPNYSKPIGREPHWAFIIDANTGKLTGIDFDTSSGEYLYTR